MTEKIIIDGVDVSGCEHLDTEKDDCPVCNARPEFQDWELMDYEYCRNCPNCYYKQLQRTTAQYNAVVDQNKSLQAECEELKERLNEVLCDVDTKECEHRMFCGEPIGYGCQIYENHSCNDNDFLNCNFRQKQRLKQENICYKQALDEIKKNVTPVEYTDVDRKIIFGSVCHSQILDIINKADFGKSETRLGESFVEKVEPPIIQEAKEVNNET